MSPKDVKYIKFITSVNEETYEQLQKMAKEQQLPFATLIRTLIIKALKAGL
jgi:predicted CopG family antitoxin